MSAMDILKRSFALSFYLNLIYYMLGLFAYLFGMPGMAYIFVPHAFASLYLVDPAPGTYPMLKFIGLLLFAFMLTTLAITLLFFIIITLIRRYRSR